MSLQFGTAGLRAPVGPGPDQMNVTQITRTTAGLAAWLATQHIPHPARQDPELAAVGDIGALMFEESFPLRVAIGYDARYGSHTFATTAAEVFAGAGFEVMLLPTPTPTPVLAWVVREFGLDAGVQITASHNPAADNGYKVYLADGAQLVSPADREIEAYIRSVQDPHEVPRVSVRPAPDITRRYIDALADAANPVEGDRLRVNNERAALKIAYTAMHGVGGKTLNNALAAAGFALAWPVEAQQYPDPTFPTVDFPNPEEPGATDLVLERAAEVDADIVIALDPDADRCAIGVRTADGGHRMLRGDELGPLLATRLVARRGGSEPAPVVATTVVSSQLLGEIAKDYGWDYQETLTGFKNLARAADDRPGELAFAYEEAIGTCPLPDMVSDKDGIATAVLTCAWAAELKATGTTLLDELEKLYRTYGRFVGTQVAIRTTDPKAVVANLAEHAPETLGGVPVKAEPYAGGVKLSGEGVRVIARASGTEPKAKLYLEANEDDLLTAITLDIQLAIETL